MTDTSPAADWPFTLADPVRAVHFALDPGCPHDRPQLCPDEAKARQAIDAYRAWLAAHPTADDRTVIDQQPPQTGPVAPHGPHSPSGAPTPTRTPERAARARTGVRVFHLQRDRDVSGVSGTGTVADGVLWPDGSVTIRWRGLRPSTVNWQSLQDAEAVHGHGGATRIVWADTPDSGPYAAALERELTRYARTETDPGTGSDVGDQVAIVLAVRDRRMEQLAAERDRARRIAVALENENAAHDERVAELRERARIAQAAALNLRAQTPTAGQATLDRIRAARTWGEVWSELGMYYGMKPEEAGLEARDRREGGVIQNLADAEQRVRAAKRRTEQAEAAITRVRDLTAQWATHCMHIQTRWLLAETDAALDGREAPARTGDGHAANCTTEQAELRTTVARVRAECDAIARDVHGKNPIALAGYREANARIRAALDGVPAGGPLTTGPIDWATDVIPTEPPATLAEAQERHRQLLHRRRESIAAITHAWERHEIAAVRDLVRLASKEGRQ